MLYISHRGNLDGINPELENNPKYISNALDIVGVSYFFKNEINFLVNNIISFYN